MRRNCKCGLEGDDAQCDEPAGEPLPRVVVTGWWAPSCGGTSSRSRMAPPFTPTKHIRTRRYLYLTSSGAAFEYTPVGRSDAPGLTLQAALCKWWMLDGWDEEDARAVRAAILRAGRSMI